MQSGDRVGKETARHEALGKVRETRDLLEMLEFLFSKVNERRGENGALPWGGVKATLERATRHLFDVENALVNASTADEPMLEQQENVYDRARRGELQARPIRPLSLPDEEATSPGPTAQESPRERAAEPADHRAAGGLAGRIQMAPQPKSGRRGYAREIPIGKDSAQVTAGAK